MADEPVIDPIEPVAEPAPAPAAVDPPAPAPEPAPAPAPQMVPLRVLQERVGEETSKRQTAEDRATAAETRAREFEAIVQRLQAKPADPAAPASRVEPATPARPTVPASVDQSAIAQARVQLQLEDVSKAGVKAYGPKWDQAISALNAYDANTVDFVMGVIEVDPSKAHEIMFQLAQDGEKAVQLAKMSPAARIAAITRMSDAMAAEPKPADVQDPPAAPKAAISRAPAPKPAIAPIAPAQEIDPTTPEGNEKMSDRDFERWYKDKHYKRTA